MSQISRRSEAGNHKPRTVLRWALLSNGYFVHFFHTMSIVQLFHSFECRKIPPNDFSWRCFLYRSTIFKSWLQLLSASIFGASKQVPLISTSSQRQQKAVKRICSAYLDKQWLEEFVLQTNVLNDREFSIAKQKSNSIQELETPGLHRELKSDLLTGKFDFFWFAWIRKKTNSDSEHSFRPCSDPCETRFVGTH